MALLDFLWKLFGHPAGSNNPPSGETELREFTIGGERHWVQVPKETFQVSGSKLHFWQTYVQKEVLAVKRAILRLKTKYPEDWREHIGEVGDSFLRKELIRQDLTNPIIVVNHPELEGALCCYGWCSHCFCFDGRRKANYCKNR